MAHKMGLAQFTLGSITIPTTITYLNNTETNRTGSNTITASNSFNGFTPFDNSGTYLYLIRPATSTSLNSNTGTDQWTSALTYNLTAGSTSAQTAYSRRHNWNYITGIWNYNYQERVYELVTPFEGSYELKVWGSQGRARGWMSPATTDYGGKGGYSYGTINLEAGKKLYVCVGGNIKHDATSEGGYNGGGRGAETVRDYPNANAGGGATHIAINNNRGVLANYKDNKEEVLIVAGGGGGGEWAGDPGVGGGTSGTNGNAYDKNSYTNNGQNIIGTAGTSNSGGTTATISTYTCYPTNGSFGQGGWGYARNGGADDYGAGGGGGWYGGGGTCYTGMAGGGSGYINTGAGVSGSTIAGTNSFTSPSGANETGHTGTGYARISITRQ